MSTGDSSKLQRPLGVLSFFRPRNSSKSAKSRPSSAGVLSPRLTARSSDSDESRSNQSSKSRGRASFKGLMSRLRSSSSVTLVEGPQLQEADFKQIGDWFTGFDRYDQLVTTVISPDPTYPSENFTRISKILSKNCGGRFIHGLPEALFDFALLWCPAGPLKMKDNCEPTWSWTRFEGPVNFPFDPTNSPDLLNLPRSEAEWFFKSDIRQYHIGRQSDLYTVRREKDRRLRIQLPPYFHASRGHDASTNSNTLRFTTYAIPAQGFTAEQLDYDEKDIPCCHLIHDKKLCGVIMDFNASISEPCPTGPFEFVLLSRNLRGEPTARSRRPVIPTNHPSGTPIWNGKRFIWDQEVADFDEGVFQPGPWKMLNVMLIKWIDSYAERVAVARIHEDAWKQQKPVMKDIILQ
ncbi:hypothetical protein CC78DRAFT_582261 [Lojkania enalia]|uniref:Uncharacterized protein n=1 Tax=Lojkania enalia TaxID=147567 RepID=A0A9P4K4B3_9PLEO|nr:hypothetical protein CC78DRAFT_582261 [Didymosphaeria enalia]